MKSLMIILLVFSVILVSGCVESPEGTTEGTIGESPVTGSMTEGQALETIEQEMEQAIENINISDIEDALGE